MSQKNFAIFLSFCLLISTAGSAAPAKEQWIDFTTNEVERGGPILTLLTASGEEIILRAAFHGIRISPSGLKHGKFFRISYPGAGVLTDIGKPDVPVLRKWVEIPYGADCTVEVTASEARQYSLFDLSIQGAIIPVQPPVPKIPGAMQTAQFVMDNATYATNSLYPGEIVRLHEIVVVRGHRLALLEIFPFQYNPVRGTVKVHTDLEVKIHLAGSDLETTAEKTLRYRSAYLENMNAEQYILNFNGYLETEESAVKEAPKAPPIGGYLIIVYDSYYNQVLPLAEWKSKKGFDVTVTRRNDISPNTASGIRSYISQAYQNWTIPPDYVLLVGDTNNMPTWTGNRTSSCTDLDYTTVDGSDFIPDLGIARICARSTSETTTMINKFLEYERAEFASTAWMDKAVFMASYDNYSITEGTHNYVVSNYFEPNGFTCDKIYARLGGSTSNITSSINNGRLIANYSGHGEENSWYNPSFSMSNVSSLSNGDKYPFVVSNACLTGNFDWYNESYGERWVKVSGKGAIGFWGASTYSYWDEDDILEKRLWKALLQDHVYPMADLTDAGKWGLYQYYGGGGSTEYYYEAYNVQGEPSLDIWTGQPDTLNVSHASTCPLYSHNFQVTVTSGGSNVNNALVCLYKDSDVHVTGYTNSSGQVTLDPDPGSLGTLYVTVTKHDYTPYEGSSSVEPAGNQNPVLSGGSVSPAVGYYGTRFIFTVDYYDMDGDSPSTMQVNIDGIDYDMTLDSGSASNGTYRYQTRDIDSEVSHIYYFYAEDGEGGSGREPATGVLTGPASYDPDIFVSGTPALGAWMAAELWGCSEALWGCAWSAQSGPFYLPASGLTYDIGPGDIHMVKRLSKDPLYLDEYGYGTKDFRIGNQVSSGVKYIQGTTKMNAFWGKTNRESFEIP